MLLEKEMLKFNFFLVKFIGYLGVIYVIFLIYEGNVGDK